MDKKNSKKIVDGIIYVLLIAIGFIFGKLINIPYFNIDKQINVVDLFSIAVTVLAAFVVTKILDKEKEDRRTEKDLILKRTEDIYQLIEVSQTKLTSPNIPYEVAASHIKNIYVYLDTVYKIISKTEIRLSEDHKNKILTNLRKLRDLLTGGGTIVANGSIALTQNRILEIAAEFVRLKDNVLLFQIDINKG